MERSEDTAAALLNSTVRVISREGLSKASIRMISADCNIPNPYIYQHFKDKDALLIRAFEQEDRALADVFMKNSDDVRQIDPAAESRCHALWRRLWEYMMEHRDSIRFYVKYYYSEYYPKYSRADHNSRFRPVVQRMSVCIREEANRQVLFQHMLDTMMNMAMKVYSEELHDTEENREHFFAMIMGSLRSYINDKCTGSQEDCLARMGQAQE